MKISGWAIVAGIIAGICAGSWGREAAGNGRLYRYHVVYSVEISGANGPQVVDLMAGGEIAVGCTSMRLVENNASATVNRECVVEVYGDIPSLMLAVTGGAVIDAAVIGYRTIEPYNGDRQ